MRNKWIKRIFPFIALLLLLPWPVAYAFDDTASQDTVQIEIAEESAKPNYTAFGKAVGSVNPGELFYFDASNNSADIVVTLSITNANQLISHYSYMILNVGVYAEVDGEWIKATGSNGELISDTFITMRNGQTSFILPGYANYKLTIDSGAFYCTNAGTDSNSLSPNFFLEVD
jgi:hypothetical protein